jgi:exopolyphosphatase/guanosine-5'-triphosphate,3'-diphosphate pyrophosphatase
MDVHFDPQSCRAVADLGSNTFHLMVGRLNEGNREILLHMREAVGIGKDGMEKKRILPEAKDRAIAALERFASELAKLGIKASDAEVYATSAFRNAENALEIIEEIQIRTGFQPNIISGHQEAAFIFRGVLESGALRENEDSLIVDIGGGSVEFILCRGLVPVWKESLEIGGLRLMERFHQIDPLPAFAISALNEHLRQVLLPIREQTSELSLLNLIGCSGSFETMIDLRNAGKSNDWKPSEQTAVHQLTSHEFEEICQQVLPLAHQERLRLPGMIPLRAGMMPVALILVKILMEETRSQGIRVSTWSLKEGALFQHFKATDHAIY